MTKKTEKKEEENPSCGIIRPISAIPDNIYYAQEHWEEVQRIIEEALSSSFAVKMVSEADEAGVLPARIIKNLYTSDLVICDISQRNPNVMFELGIRIAFDKPVIIISDDCCKPPFDMAHIEYIPYSRDLNYYKVQKFQEQLLQKASSTFEAYQKGGFSLLKEIGDIQTFKFDDNISKQNQLEKFAEEIFTNFHMLHRDIAEMRENISAIRRNRSDIMPYRFLPLSQQQEIRHLIQRLNTNESFKKDLQNLGLMETIQKLKNSFPDQLSMIPSRILAEIIRRECLN